MKGLTNTTNWRGASISSSESETQLIDLFVEMCFYDINNPSLIFQFKLLAQDLNYSDDIIERVVEVGKSEYQKLYTEIELQIAQAFT